MKRKFMSFKFLFISISLLAFAACSNDSPDTGSPIATYLVKGTVVDNNELPIENIRAVIKFVPSEDKFQTRQDTTYTDDKGYFELSKFSVPKKEINIEVKLSDTDGDKNGKYNKRTETITFNEKDLSYDNGWHDGIAIKNLGKITLKDNSGPIIEPDL